MFTKMNNLVYNNCINSINYLNTCIPESTSMSGIVDSSGIAWGGGVVGWVNT